MLISKNGLEHALAVLLIEDEAACRTALGDAIHCFHPTWTVYEAADGQAGLHLAQRLTPALICLDFQMPLLNGYQVALALRAHPATAQIPLILTTGADPTQPQLACLRPLCQAVLFKPFSLHQLERVLAQLQARQPGLRDQLAAVGN